MRIVTRPNELPRLPRFICKLFMADLIFLPDLLQYPRYLPMTARGLFI
jgi:hypothetical protein